MHYLIFFFLLYPLLLQAAWPIINIPTQAEILNLLSQNNCPPGNFKISALSNIKIINPYIPKDETWVWEYSGSNNCQPMTNLQDLKCIDFKQQGPMQILVGYGTISDRVLLQFNLKIMSTRNDWDCGPLIGSHPPTQIGCARDM